MSNILVVINDLDNETYLLDKALRLSPTSLCVVMVNPVGKGEDWITNKLNAYIAHIKPEQAIDIKYFYEIEYEMSASFLVDLSSTYFIDLIILVKPEIVDNLKGLALVTGLLKSPIKAKVLLVRDKKWPSSLNIMCAVDIESDDDSQIALDQSIFKYVVDVLQQSVTANLYLASVISISRISEELALVDPSSVLQKKGQQYKDKLNNFDYTKSVSASKTLVAAGAPSQEICFLAKNNNIDLVVMGNVGRKGLVGLVVGSTAEKTLKTLSADVLIVNDKT